MGGYISDDELAAEVLRERGARVTTLPWDSRPDWRLFDLVVIRTTWDYQERLAEFQGVLEGIEGLGVALCNGSEVARWNTQKTYLRDLEAGGVAIVPTRFGERLGGPEEVRGHFEHFGAEELILKPVVSASAYDTYRLRAGDVEGMWPELGRVFGARPYLAQPLIPAVLREGEFSLVYLDGRFSHAVLKRPKEGDFRSQEEYGGVITAVTAEAALLAAGERAMELAGAGLLYGRVDFVRGEDGRYLLMELEVIEPALYLRMEEGAPGRFAEAILRRVRAG